MTMLMCCVVTGTTTMPETTTSEVDTIPGEQEITMFSFLSTIPHLSDLFYIPECLTINISPSRFFFLNTLP